MVEKIVLDYLNTMLNVDAYMEEPKEPKEKYVIIEKTGGSMNNYIYRCTFALQSYANSMYEASLLNEEVKKVMNSIIQLDSISKSELNSDYNYTDTTKKKYRYQAVYDLVVLE